MADRNPIAAGLAKPQYRQRVDGDANRRALLRWHAAHRAELEWCDRMEADERYGTVAQLEGWQEPLRQMEG